MIHTEERDIPATVFAGGRNSRLVIMVHSFKSDRFEDGRFTECGRLLADKGISSVAPDLRKVNELSIDNALRDLEECLKYMKAVHEVNGNDVSVIGYSLGGRIASLFTARHPEIKKLVLWAGANEELTQNDSFLKQDLGRMVREADTKGYADFHDIYTGENDRLSGEFVHDLLDESPLLSLSRFRGKTLIIQGKRDTTIDPGIAVRTYKALPEEKDKTLLWMEEADHGFGIFDGRKEDSIRLIESTVSFII